MCTPWPISDRPQMTVTCPSGAMRRKAFGAKPAAAPGAAAAAWAKREDRGSVKPMTRAPAAEPLRKSRRVVNALVLMAVSLPQAPSVAAASLMAARMRL